MLSLCFKPDYQPYATSDNECSICLTPFNNRQAPQILRCHHEFHGSCIANWLASHNSCPLCRDVVSSTFHCARLGARKTIIASHNAAVEQVLQEPDRYTIPTRLGHTFTVDEASATLQIKTSQWRKPSILFVSAVKEFYGVDEYLMFTVPSAESGNTHEVELHTVLLHSVAERENLYKMIKETVAKSKQSHLHPLTRRAADSTC
eukprot:m.20232 g.20232  ORF g.20232 m.20232 type:complete len:204 (+) comp11018_c0_seq1:92-703(+)